MSENPEGTISLDQAVEQMWIDTTAEEETTEEAEEAAPQEVEVEAETEDTEAEGEPEAEPEFEVETVTGKKKVKLSELLESPMFKADYTRKTQALAEERRAFEQEQAQKQAQTAQEKQQLAEALQKWAVPTEQEPDWQTLARELSPQDFNLRRVQWEQRQRRAFEAREQFIALQQQETQLAVKTELGRLMDAIPEWRDEAKFKAAAVKMQEAGTEYGFRPEEIASIVDHRMVRVLHDAAQYRELKKGAPAVAKKVAQAPVALKPGAKTSPKASEQAARQEQRAKLRKTGSVDDAIELLFNR